jgi:KilA-N domain/Protein of unknown function (DUF3627)
MFSIIHVYRIGCTKLQRALFIERPSHSGGKEYKEWIKNKSSQQLIQTLQTHMALENTQSNFQNSDCILQNRGGRILPPLPPPCKYIGTENRTDVERLISGTYCHPDLIPHIACWISPDFALKVSKVVNSYMIEEYKHKLHAAEQTATELLFTLHLSNQALEDAQLALGNAEQTVATTQLAMHSSEEEGKQLTDLVQQKSALVSVKQEEIGQLQKKVDHKTRERRVWASTHGFTMLQLNDQTSHMSHYAIRCLGHRLNTAINKLKRKHPSAQIIYRNQHVPNAINLYKRLKSHRIVEYKHNYCTPTCSQSQLLYLLNSLCEDAYSAPLLKSDTPCIIKQETASQW